MKYIIGWRNRKNRSHKPLMAIRDKDGKLVPSTSIALFDSTEEAEKTIKDLPPGLEYVVLPYDNKVIG